MQPISDLEQLLRHMRPQRNPGRYAFVTHAGEHTINPGQIIASIHEPERLSAIIPEQTAHELQIPIVFTAAWITLTVHSYLSAVGQTAAFTTALAQAGVSCNVVAGVYRDHVFVPVEQAQLAMTTLRAQSRPTG